LPPMHVQCSDNFFPQRPTGPGVRQGGRRALSKGGNALRDSHAWLTWHVVPEYIWGKSGVHFWGGQSLEAAHLLLCYSPSPATTLSRDACQDLPGGKLALLVSLADSVLLLARAHAHARESAGRCGLGRRPHRELRSQPRVCCEYHRLSDSELLTVCVAELCATPPELFSNSPICCTACNCAALHCTALRCTESRHARPQYLQPPHWSTFRPTPCSLIFPSCRVARDLVCL